MVRGPAAAAQKDPRWDLDRDATWADSIQRYDKEKLVAPPVPQVLPGRKYRDARTNQKTEERHYDVLTHKWRDDAMEEMKSKEQTAALVQHMDKAAARAVKYESHFDVINHRRKVGVPEPPPPPPKVVERPPSPVPAAGQAKPHRERKPKPSYFWPTTYGRDYHILSNRYLQSDHDQRAAREHQEAKEEAAKRFFRTNRYNAVTGAFYNPDEEERFQRDRVIASQEHGKDLMRRAPPHFEQSEGFVYNILAPQIAKDCELLVRQDRKQAQRESQPRLKAEFENNLQNRMDQAKASQLSRAMNRTSEKRYTDIVEKGYNILTNQPFKGRLGRPYPAPYQRQNIPPPEPYFGLQAQQQQQQQPPYSQYSQPPQQQQGLRQGSPGSGRPGSGRPRSRPSPAYSPSSQGGQGERTVRFDEQQYTQEYEQYQQQLAGQG